MLDQLTAQETAVWNAEVARQQADVMEEKAADMAKIMEVAHRIATGGIVPASDEKNCWITVLRCIRLPKAWEPWFRCGKSVKSMTLCGTMKRRNRRSMILQERPTVQRRTSDFQQPKQGAAKPYEKRSGPAALTGFWLESSLLISPVEQTAVMERIFGVQADYSAETVNHLKQVMLLSEPKDADISVYGKTGMGSFQGTVVDAWYTGFADMGEKRLYFCVYLGETDSQEVSSARAREIALQILSQY